MAMAQPVLVWRSLVSVDVKFALTSKSLRQFVKYAVIGLLTNSIGYSVYLLLTYLWGAPKLTMTVLYGVGATISFLANRRYTFQHDGPLGAAGIRYILVQICGYLFNLLLLVIFVDWLRLPHQIVQGVAVFAVAALLFVLTKLFVFPARTG